MAGRKEKERALLLSVLVEISERLERANTISAARFALEKQAVEMASQASQVDPVDVATKMMEALASTRGVGVKDEVEVIVEGGD